VIPSCLSRWFFHLVEGKAQGDQTQVVALALPAACGYRPSVADPPVQVTITHTAADMVIQVKGEARVDCAGALMGGLLGPAACRPAVVTLDLSELRSISSLAMGVLVAYRRGVVRTGGRVRLAEELQPAVREALTRAELLDLFEPPGSAGPARNRPDGSVLAG
jgi:anti-anti-sigma factor